MAAMPPTASAQLCACGDDEVRELQIDANGVSEPWRWDAARAADLPAEYQERLLRHIDDGKPVDNGRRILITASTRGAVLIDRTSGKVVFRAKVPMAHSAALLPGGLLAVALSIHPAGDRPELYDSRHSETPLQSVPLPSGHGAVWDARRKRLFALSHDLAQAFRLRRTAQGTPLKESARWLLLGRRDGHDLSTASGGDYYVTTQDGAWRFSPDDGGSEPFAPLTPTREVKSTSGAPYRVAWVQAEESWWAHGFTVMLPDGGDARRVPVEGLHLYKVHWAR